MMSDQRIRAPLLWAVCAFFLTIVYAAYLQPEWEPRLDDQADYLQLAHGLAARGEYTRALPGEAFLAEPHRRPGYPLLLSALCRTVDCGHWQIALVQATLLAGTVLLVALIAREVLPPLGASTAAGLTGLYLPLAYHAALAVSETLAVFLGVGAVALYLRARRQPTVASSLACGMACGLLALTRPAFLLFPLIFVVAHVIRDASARRGDLRVLVLLLATAVTVQLPYIAYSFASFGGPNTSTSGTVLWLGYLQGRSGGDAASTDSFTEAAIAGVTGEPLAVRGAAMGLDSVESEEVAGALRDVRLFNAAPDRAAELQAFITLTESLQARATHLIAHDPAGYVVRGLTSRSIALWAGDIPLRADVSASLSEATRIAIAAIELVMFFAGLLGVVILVARRRLAGMVIAGVVLYVWLVSIPFLTEGRYALPARPFVLIAIVVFAFAASPQARRPRIGAGPPTSPPHAIGR
jgi:4-amino-4-deoxy-L-arabinose transferase-like glycosyltransferase